MVPNWIRTTNALCSSKRARENVRTEWKPTSVHMHGMGYALRTANFKIHIHIQIFFLYWTIREFKWNVRNLNKMPKWRQPNSARSQPLSLRQAEQLPTFIHERMPGEWKRKSKNLSITQLRNCYLMTLILYWPKSIYENQRFKANAPFNFLLICVKNSLIYCIRGLIAVPIY